MDSADAKPTVPKLMRNIGGRARAAYERLASSTSAHRSEALLHAAREVRERASTILSANRQDVEQATAQGLGASMVDRLSLDPPRVESMAAGLEAIAPMPDPIGRVLAEWPRPNGLVIQRVSIPIGVIGMIYESRPGVTADAAGLCIKSGNACILRGGSESLRSSMEIAACLHEGLRTVGLPTDCVQLVPVPDREAVGEMLTMIGLIDLIIPRGGKSLTTRVMEQSRVPTLLHLEGNCHTYIHEGADAQMAVAVVVNAKMRRVGVCGATESLVIDRAVARDILPRLSAALRSAGCEVRGDPEARAIDAHIAAASEADWGTEYLAPIISVRVVAGIEEAIAHINRYGSRHTDAIITRDAPAARRFEREVDSAIVLHNASTQFADGGEFGFGAEIGIATGRLHARGPVGADQLTTYKYIVRGTGQVRP